MKTRTNTQRPLFAFFVRYVAFVAAAFILVCATTLIPQSAILQNVSESSTEIAAERAANDLRNYPNAKAAQTSTFTTAIMFSILLHQDADHVLSSSMDGAFCRGQTDETFYNLEKNAGLPADTNYAFYWHGWAPIVKPLLTVFDYTEIKRLFAVLLVLLLAALSVLMERALSRGGWPVGAAIAVGTALLRGFETMHTLPYFFSFAVALTASCVLAWRYPKRHGSGALWLYLLFFTTGMIVAFMDFLITPLLSFTLPLLCYVVLAYGQRESGPSSNHLPTTRGIAAGKDILLFILCAGLLWVAGYVGMLAAKWLLASIILGYNVFQEAGAEVLFRLGASDQGPTTSVTGTSPLTALWLNVCVAFSRPLLALAACFALVCAVVAAVRRPQVTAGLVVGLVVVAILPYVWYIGVSNHSEIHFYFTCRNQIATITALIMLGYYLTRPKTQ